MELPDFGVAEEFARLRSAMGVTEVIVLREPEWQDWSGFGIDIGDISDVEANSDGTLSYRGRRVLVYIRDQFIDHNDELRDYRYHVAECRTLETMRQRQRFGRYVVTTRADGHFVVNLLRQGSPDPFETNLERDMGVCKNCLTALDWRNYTDLHGEDKTRCWETFDPKAFLDEYGSRVKGLPSQTPETAPLNQYPANWSEISRRVRERSGWICQGCSLSFREPRARRWLHVHHRDGDRSNSSPQNLKALCIGCHQKEFGHEQLRNSPDFSGFLRWRSSQTAPPFGDRRL